MPIYEYACRSCGHEFEAILKTTDPAPPCPKCDGAPEKKVSLAAFHLKGGGWYKDLYSGKDNKSASAGTSSESPATASSTATEAASSAPASAPPSAPATPSSSPAPASS